jgi:hypothetical protein
MDVRGAVNDWPDGKGECERRRSLVPEKAGYRISEAAGTFGGSPARRLVTVLGVCIYRGIKL